MPAWTVRVLRTVQVVTGAAQARATLEAAMSDVLIPPKFARYPEVGKVGAVENSASSHDWSISIDGACAGRYT